MLQFIISICSETLQQKRMGIMTKSVSFNERNQLRQRDTRSCSAAKNLQLTLPHESSESSSIVVVFNTKNTHWIKKTRFSGLRRYQKPQKFMQKTCFNVKRQMNSPNTVAVVETQSKQTQKINSILNLLQ